ncbi:helix-turn-helix domain-containing protein [Brachybacterium fresconis]|uniref:AraC-like DNA-binding protein n=1 Tax=Brachybacterium fresconis TaxID=173363 RepID=A0ABS4YNJ4_9MICO|nr:helix-turn-helix domain-containing protein [Brachybacterium fresconis]MBP2409977.1 AraC-like DNA-binding protein [Brachybacterium fresconis]
MRDTDPLRRLLDAVLEEGDGSLEAMASGAHLSPFYFQRTVRAGAGESPSMIRRRVLLEQAAWRLQRGTAVTDAALEAGYDSVDGFSRAFHRAFGCAPSRLPPAVERGHWLPAPNGLHFHSPTVLYLAADGTSEVSSGDVTLLMVEHDLEDIEALLAVTQELSAEELDRVRLPGHRPRFFDGSEETIAQTLRHLVLSREPWLAAVAGEEEPDLGGPSDPAALRERHARTGARWLALMREIRSRGAWQDRVIDALCDPPESFLIGQIVAHELTFSAHRRQSLRWMLADAGADLAHPALDPDPILWHRRRTGDQP